MYASDATVELPDAGRNRRKEQQTLGRVVLDDAGDEAEAVALADGIPVLGAGEVQVCDADIFEFEGRPDRRFGTLVPSSNGVPPV